jgi:hypothetical protein
MKGDTWVKLFGAARAKADRALLAAFEREIDAPPTPKAPQEPHRPILENEARLNIARAFGRAPQ